MNYRQLCLSVAKNTGLTPAQVRLAFEGLASEIKLLETGTKLNLRRVGIFAQAVSNEKRVKLRGVWQTIPPRTRLTFRPSRIRYT